MKLGVITDGISRDLNHALTVMTEFGLDWAELQFIGDKEVGDLNAAEQIAALELVKRHEKRVSCISRHLFAGMVMGQSEVNDALHTAHLDALKRCIEMARRFEAPLVRIMTGKKEAILFGANGAEVWNVAKGAWDRQLELLAPAMEIARAEGARLVVETGNGTMVNSCATARRLIDDLDATDVLSVLWDPANALWCGERAMPDGFGAVAGGYIGHVHVKDVRVDPPAGRLEVRPMGNGDLARDFGPMAMALRGDGYDGVISIESVYHPGNGRFEDGFRLCIERFKAHFGAAA